MENYYFLKNKYYPKTLNDLCLDKKIIILLKNLIKLNNLNILFISNPGSCKTTLINIILKYYYNDRFIDYDNLIDENFINNYSNYCDVNK
jgi:type IV secretory pathway ATPase VirB11/archaellum biosynthesis ATPase